MQYKTRTDYSDLASDLERALKTLLIENRHAEYLSLCEAIQQAFVAAREEVRCRCIAQGADPEPKFFGMN